MNLSRKQRLAKETHTSKRQARRWIVRFFGIIVLVLCIYTVWDVMNKQSSQESEKEQPSDVRDLLDDTDLSEIEHRPPADLTIIDEATAEEQQLPNEQEQNINPIPNEQVSLAFVGDIMLGGNVGKLLINNGYDYPYYHVSTILSEADIAAGNMENPITERGEPAEDKSYIFRTSPLVVPELVKSGLDLFNLANNHTLDYGLIGLEDTIRSLDEAGLYNVGAGNNQEEAYEAVVIEKNGIRVAYIGLSRVVPEVSWKAGKHSPGVAETYDYTRPVKAIEAANEISDMVVVMVHWGVEGATEPRSIEKELAHRYIDAGADLVIGSHPHVLQGFESYKGKWIAYSLGNFIFTTSGKAGTNETAIVHALCSKSGDCQLDVIPLVAGIAQPQRMEDNAALELYKHLTSISYSSEVLDDGRVSTLESINIR